MQKSTWTMRLAQPWVPPWCRWPADEALASPPEFNIYLNILFACAGTVTVANLYYAQPLLGILAEDFNVDQERASLIPTCSQAGYAAGLILICPLGDMVRRRPFLLLLTFITPTLWIGLCLSRSFSAFTALAFLSSVTTVTPQVLLPLVGDLSPPARRATALSIVSSGLVLGLLFARLSAGLITTYSHWRNVYWLALGLQYLVCGLLWLFLPDYPSTNTDITYIKGLVSIVGLYVRHPVLVQATLIGLLISATFTSFWTTVTFLLSGAPYEYSPLRIALLSLAGLTPMFLNPVYSRLVIDRYVTLVAVTISLILMLAGVSIGTFTGTFTIAGPVLQACLQDMGLQATMVANRVAIYAVAPKARNRINTGYMVGTFCGQLMGTSVGNRVYTQAGWVGSGTLSLALLGAALMVCLARGPRETGWIGWAGGMQIRRDTARRE